MVSASHSLRRRLTTRLLVLQLATLFAVAASSALIFYYFDDYSGARFDGKIAEVIAANLTLSGNELTLVPSNELDAIRRTSPNLWFVVQDGQGRRLEQGIIPVQVMPLISDLSTLAILEVIDEDFTADVFLQAEGSTVGDVKIAFGGGKPPTWWVSLLSFAGFEVGPILALIVAAIGGVTILVVPRVIAASFSSLQAVESVASSIDIDQRGVRLPHKDVPAEIAALVSAVNAALSRLDDGYEQKQRFLADAAHELRTPIAILQSRLELAPRNNLENRLLLDVHRLANLAEQLLDLQQVGNRSRPSQTVEMVSTARQVMADLAPLAVTAGYDPVFESAVDSLEIWGDRSALERALINLVQNAISHGGGGGEIVLFVGNDRTIAISDSGPGVPDDRREWIFEPFHRIKPLNEGSGLGLSLVKEIVEKHGGSITVGASPTGGARFLMRFD